MSDPLDELASAHHEPSRSPVLPYATPPVVKPDKTIYVALIAAGCLVTIVMLWFVVAAPAPVTPIAPTPVAVTPAAPAQPPRPLQQAAPIASPRAQTPVVPVRAADAPPAPTEWTIPNAAELKPVIMEDGWLQIIVTNKSPFRLVNLKIDIRTSVEENATQEVLIPSIDPGKQFSQAFDFPELRRRAEPRAIPSMEISEGDFASR